MSKSEPLYVQIAETLKREILEGRVKPLDRLGSQREFCDRFGVSPITVEWALRKLDADGVINRVRGRGTYVAEDVLKQQNKGRRIGVVGHMDTDWDANVYVRDLYRSVQVEAQRTGILLRFYEREAQYAQLLDDDEVDGLILLAPRKANVEQLEQLEMERHHYVVVAGDWGIPPMVLIDNQRGVHDALDHLSGLGHRRVALITDLLDSTDAVACLRAYQEYCEEHDWHAPAAWLMHRSDYAIHGEEEQRAFDHFFGHGDPPTAILAMGSNYGADMIRILQARGVRVPEDVSVIGFDLPPYDPVMQGRLTSIIQPLDRLGARALQLLEQKIGGRRLKNRTLLPPRLQVGSTAGPVAPSLVSAR